MNNSKWLCLIIAVVIIFFNACSNSPKVINDLGGASYQLVNEDSARVNFLQDFKGKYTILSFVYTHCPYMCHLITANMSNIQRRLGPKSKVQFIEISFDPIRDTPSRLQTYMHQYKLNFRNFTMLTGDSTTVDSVMKSANIKYWVTKKDTTASGKPFYIFKHTNRIDVLDKKGRVRFEYPGSVVSPERVIKDLNKMRPNHEVSKNS